MGFQVLLIAVTGKETDAIHRAYGVTPTGQYEAIPESPVNGAVLPSGAYLLYVNDEITPDNRLFAKLSKGGSLLACYANETVMNSYAASWADGVEQWSVFHDAQQGVKHLETWGRVPDQLRPIQERLFAEQESADGVDYIFDIPIELFVVLGGIGYDRDIEGADPEPWQTLDRR